MSNIYVSNGTCYTGKGKKLDPSFIPCGNVAFGHQTCCGAGDNCLVNGACWGDYGSGYGGSLTYMAGCTDEDYADSKCPVKEVDQPWVALTHCEGNPGAWAICSQDGNPSTLQPGSHCSCTLSATATVAFKDNTVLASSASLPERTGQSIQFFAGYIPTPPPPGNPGTSQSPGSGSGSGSPTGNPTGSFSGSPTQSGDSSAPTGPDTVNDGTPPPNGDPSSGSGLSARAKAGIGVGVGVGVILILALALMFFLRYRRRRLGSKAHRAKASSKADARVSGVSTTPTMSEADGKPISEVDGKAARPWSMRSELEGSQVSSDLGERGSTETTETGDGHGVGRLKRSAELSPVAELAGSDSWQMR